jgi:hypothetical protein
MDILTINAIINSVEKLTSEGQELFFWWLFLDKIIPCIIGIFLIIGTLKTITYAIKVTNDDPEERIHNFLSRELKNPNISLELKTFINKLKDFLKDY